MFFITCTMWKYIDIRQKLELGKSTEITKPRQQQTHQHTKFRQNPIYYTLTSKQEVIRPFFRMTMYFWAIILLPEVSIFALFWSNQSKYVRGCDIRWFKYEWIMRIVQKNDKSAQNCFTCLCHELLLSTINLFVRMLVTSIQKVWN